MTYSVIAVSTTICIAIRIKLQLDWISLAVRNPNRARPDSQVTNYSFVFRCYNCGEFANHIAAKCTMGPQPKRCHNCKSEEHLIADCPLRSERHRTPPGGASEQESDGASGSGGAGRQDSGPSDDADK